MLSGKMFLSSKIIFENSTLSNRDKTKRTTFVKDLIMKDNDDINGGSIKSASSYDASKISFQGKRAIFEASKSIPCSFPSNKPISLIETINTNPSNSYAQLEVGCSSFSVF